MKKKLTISFDLDGVWCDFVFGFTQVARDLGLINHVSCVHEQKFWSFKDSHQLKDRDHEKLVKRLEELGDEFWENIPPVGGQLPWNTYKSLANREDVEIVFITSRRFCTVQGIQNWFKKYGEINIEDKKVFIVTHNDKRSAALRAKVDLHIDDSPEALELLVGKPYPKTLVGIKYKYNQHMWKDKNIVWVDSLIDYLLICQKYLKEII